MLKIAKLKIRKTQNLYRSWIFVPAKLNFFQGVSLSVKVDIFITIKGATKSYFTDYSCMVIILFSTGLCRSTFSAISFEKLVFCFPVLYVFFALNQILSIKTLKYALSCYVIYRFEDNFPRGKLPPNPKTSL